MISRRDTHNGYASAARIVRTKKSAEFEIAKRVTHGLARAIKNKSKNYPQFVDALHKNRSLWQLWAIDVANAENGLPDTVKARILYLAEFTHIHTSKVLTNKASALPLLEVNKSILNGLRN